MDLKAADFGEDEANAFFFSVVDQDKRNECARRIFTCCVVHTKFANQCAAIARLSFEYVGKRPHSRAALSMEPRVRWQAFFG
jgi:hypothetical protein